MKIKPATESDVALDKTSKKKGVFTDKQLQFALAEYSALRSEIVKRSEFRYQVLSFNVVIFGTILSFGLQDSSPSYILFVFPVIAYFLAGIWAHNLRGSRRLSGYIREHIEVKFDTVGWESGVYKDPYFSPRWSGSISSTSGIFLGTALIATMLGLFRSNFIILDYVLVAFDFVIIILTLFTLRSAVKIFGKRM